MKTQAIAKITAKQIATLPENDGLLLFGTTSTEEGVAPERFATFRQFRMSAYVESLLANCEGHTLKLAVTELDGTITTYKITR
jgi:hypothetical protein